MSKITDWLAAELLEFAVSNPYLSALVAVPEKHKTLFHATVKSLEETIDNSSPREFVERIHTPRLRGLAYDIRFRNDATIYVAEIDTSNSYMNLHGRQYDQVYLWHKDEYSAEDMVRIGAGLTERNLGWPYAAIRHISMGSDVAAVPCNICGDSVGKCGHIKYGRAIQADSKLQTFYDQILGLPFTDKDNDD